MNLSVSHIWKSLSSLLINGKKTEKVTISVVYMNYSLGCEIIKKLIFEWDKRKGIEDENEIWWPIVNVLKIVLDVFSFSLVAFLPHMLFIQSIKTLLFIRLLLFILFLLIHICLLIILRHPSLLFSNIGV